MQTGPFFTVKHWRGGKLILFPLVKKFNIFDTTYEVQRWVKINIPEIGKK